MRLLLYQLLFLMCCMGVPLLHAVSPKTERKKEIATVAANTNKQINKVKRIDSYHGKDPDFDELHKNNLPEDMRRKLKSEISTQS